MKIDVTQEDIDKGLLKICSKCPVARALSRAFGRLIRVGKNGTNEYVYSSLHSYSGWNSLPRKVSEIIEKYDSGIEIKPFSFTIEDSKE